MTLLGHAHRRYLDVEVEEGRGQARKAPWGRGKFEGFFEGCETSTHTAVMGI